MLRLERWALSAFLLWHLVAMAASALEDTPVGPVLLPWTRPYERAFGVHQNWDMFSPNPPLSTQWLQARGIDPTGAQVELAVLDGEPDPHGILWSYDRESKFDRNAAGKSRGAIRRGYARWLCRRHPDVVSVSFESWVSKTPRPGGTRLPRAQWEKKATDLGAVDCPP